MIDHYKRGCDSNDASACRELGSAYLQGIGLPKSEAAAVLWLARGCRQDVADAIACRLAGMMKYDGVGGARDIAAAKLLLKHGCDLKDDQACKALATVTSATGKPPE